MRITEDTRLEELKMLEHLLSGYNYEVWFNLYGPSDGSLELVDSLRLLISDECQISDVELCTPNEATQEIMKNVLCKGNDHYGPKELKSKEAKIRETLSNVFHLVNIDNAQTVSRFRFAAGSPFVEIYWSFCFDIISNGQRWIFLGASED